MAKNRQQDLVLREVEQPTRKYDITTRQDPRKIFESNAPFLADLALRKIEAFINSPDPELSVKGIELLAKFRKNMFRELPTETTQVTNKQGSISEELLGRILGAIDGKSHSKPRTVVEAEASVVGGTSRHATVEDSQDTETEVPEEEGVIDPSEGGLLRPVHSVQKRIPARPFQSPKVGNGARLPLPPTRDNKDSVGEEVL